MPAAPVRMVLIPAGSTAATGGASQPINCSEFSRLVFYLASAGTTSGGTVLIEEADWDPETETVYSGTWSQVASIAASSFTGTAQIAYHISPNEYAFLRVRISSDITGGGSIKVTARAAAY